MLGMLDMPCASLPNHSVSSASEAIFFEKSSVMTIVRAVGLQTDKEFIVKADSEYSLP